MSVNKTSAGANTEISNNQPIIQAVQSPQQREIFRENQQKRTQTRFNSNPMMQANQGNGGNSHSFHTRVTHNRLIVQSHSKEGKTSPELTNNIERIQQRLKLNNSHLVPSADRSSKLGNSNRIAVRPQVSSPIEISGFEDSFVPPRVGKSLALSIR